MTDSARVTGPLPLMTKNNDYGNKEEHRHSREKETYFHETQQGRGSLAGDN